MLVGLHLAAIATVLAESPVRGTVMLILSLLIVVVALAVVAPYLKIPYPILLVFGGLVLGFVPNLPQLSFEPDLVFLIFLPPLLYEAAWTTSWRDFKANIQSISLLAIGLVFFTTVLVAIVAHTFIPGMPWAVAFVLGAIISPTDSVAATSIAQQLSVPRRIVTIIEGESLINDASGLVTYQFAVAAVVTGTFSLGNAGLQFFISSIGGIIIGLAIGFLIGQVHRFMNNPTLEITISLLTPFVSYLIADGLHISGVLATVTTGLYLAWRAPVIFSAETRQQAYAVWENLIFLLNGLVFIIIGLQLRSILDTLHDTIASSGIQNLLTYAIIICVATILIRMAWVFPAAYLPRLLGFKRKNQDPLPSWRNVIIISWTGMRGVVSLASAFALPLVIQSGTSFPDRALLLFLTFSVIFVTLVFQGLSLPFLIRVLNLKDDGESLREEANARKTVAQAALTRIGQLIEQGEVPEEAANQLRTHYEMRARKAEENVDGTLSDESRAHLISYKNLMGETIKAEQTAAISLRNKGDIGDDVFRTIERELDLEEQRLGLKVANFRAAQGD